MTLKASGNLSGLGNADVLIHMTATGTPAASCTNPAGCVRPAARNPAKVTLAGTQAILNNQLKNGMTPVTVTTSAPVSPVTGAPECPNRQWTKNVTDVTFTGATITVTQSGVVVLTRTFTF